MSIIDGNEYRPLRGFPSSSSRKKRIPDADPISGKVYSPPDSGKSLTGRTRYKPLRGSSTPTSTPSSSTSSSTPPSSSTKTNLGNLQGLQKQLSTPSQPILRPRTTSPFYQDLLVNYQGADGKIPKTPPVGIQVQSTRSPDERFMPTPDNPHVLIKEDSFSTNITCFHDENSFLSSSSKLHGEELMALNGNAPFKSKRAAAEAVYNLRTQNGRIQPAISSGDKEKQIHFIMHSLTNQHDLDVRPTLSSPLQKALGITKDNAALLHTQHITLKNGYNGLKYLEPDGTVVTLTSAIAGSTDRENQNLQMGRRIAPLVHGQPDESAPSYCYTGRPDSFPKAFEQAQMILFSEMRSNDPKGLSIGKETIEENGVSVEKEVITLDYAINSIQSTSPLYCFHGEQEQQYVANEITSLEKLNSLPPRLVKDPRTGKNYYVRFRPHLFSRQVNVFANVSKFMDSWSSGHLQSLEVSKKGLSSLETRMVEQIAKLRPAEQALAKQLMDKLSRSMSPYTPGGQMSEAQELLCLAMLENLLKLPIVWHCKSSTDRTSIAIALTLALLQWLKLGLPIPDKFEKLLDNAYFKELFMANWVAGQQFTRNARSPDGLIKLDNILVEYDYEGLGISVNSGIGQCALLKDLLPARYLKNWGYAKQAGTFIGLTLFQATVGLFLSLAGSVGTLKHALWNSERATWLNCALFIPTFIIGIIGLPFVWTYNYVTGILMVYKGVPGKVVDFDAPGIGPRRLVKEGSKQQKKFRRPLEAIPANAFDPKALFDAAHKHKFLSAKGWRNGASSAWGSKHHNIAEKSEAEVYDLLIEQRFMQETTQASERRPLRHFLKANVIDQAAITNGLSGDGILNAVQDAKGRGWTYDIGGTDCKDAHEVLAELQKLGLSKAEAERVMCGMQQSAVSHAQAHLSKILDAKLIRANPKIIDNVTKLVARVKVTRDPNSNLLKIEIKQRNTLANDTTHTNLALIKSKTILNCDPRSNEFGQGYIQYKIDGAYTRLAPPPRVAQKSLWRLFC